MRGVTLRAGFLLGSLLPFGGGCKTLPEANLQEDESGESKSGFVRTAGQRFTLDGKPFYFQGTNFYRVAMDEQFNESELDDIFRQYAENGIRVVRFWGFSCETKPEWVKAGLKNGFHSQGKPMLDASGRVNEEALVQIDRTLHAASKAGVKVILPLVNFEHEYCGMEWWNYVYGDKEESKHAFYCNDDVIKAYRDHVKRILTRRNTKSGLVYAEDPTIMAIELANEPHTKDYYESSGKVDKSCQDKVDPSKPGDLVYNWLKDTAAYVKTLDRNHLVATGEEGYKTAGDTQKHSWLHNGSKGVSFEKNVSIPDIDFATVHLYPDNSAVPKSDFDSWYVDNVVKDRAEIAHRAGKPIVLEETGFSEYQDDGSEGMKKYAAMGYYDERPNWLRKMYQAANEANYAGTMVWQVVPVSANQQAYDDDLFTFPLTSEEGKVVKEQAVLMNRKNQSR